MECKLPSGSMTDHSQYHRLIVQNREEEANKLYDASTDVDKLKYIAFRDRMMKIERKFHSLLMNGLPPESKKYYEGLPTKDEKDACLLYFNWKLFYAIREQRMEIADWLCSLRTPRRYPVYAYRQLIKRDLVRGFQYMINCTKMSEKTVVKCFSIAVENRAIHIMDIIYDKYKDIISNHRTEFVHVLRNRLATGFDCYVWMNERDMTVKGCIIGIYCAIGTKSISNVTFIMQQRYSDKDISHKALKDPEKLIILDRMVRIGTVPMIEWYLELIKIPEDAVGDLFHPTIMERILLADNLDTANWAFDHLKVTANINTCRVAKVGITTGNGNGIIWALNNLKLSTALEIKIVAVILICGDLSRVTELIDRAPEIGKIIENARYSLLPVVATSLNYRVTAWMLHNLGYSNNLGSISIRQAFIRCQSGILDTDYEHVRQIVKDTRDKNLGNLRKANRLLIHHGAIPKYGSIYQEYFKIWWKWIDVITMLKGFVMLQRLWRHYYGLNINGSEYTLEI